MTDISTGQPQQEVNRSFIPASRGRSDIARAREEVRCARRELYPRLVLSRHVLAVIDHDRRIEEIQHGLRLNPQDKPIVNSPNLFHLRLTPLSLIYASITGYGQYGPYSQRAGYDVMVEAEFGLMHITGERTGPPVKVGVAVTDLTTGLYTANAILASLISRSSTNVGQHLDVALSDCQTATLANIASSVLISGDPDSGRWGTAHPSIVPYKGFKTKDGDIMLGGGNDRLFGIICDKLHKPEWKTDPKYVNNSVRVQHRDELEALIEAETVQKTTQQWLDILEGSGMPYAAINDVKGALELEHSKVRGMVTEVEHESCGTMRLVSPPVKYSEEGMVGVRMAPPTLGQHTGEVLGELLGMQEKEVQGLVDKGAIA